MRQHRTAPSPEESIGRLEHELTGEALAICEKHLRPALEAFGYPV
jgi:hypothetical protein